MIEPDIAKLLELLPLIERLPEVVERLKDLEDRADEAEARILYASLRHCPACNGIRVMSKPKPDPLFPESPARIRVFRCLQCRQDEERPIEPLNSRPFGVDF